MRRISTLNLNKENFKNNTYYFTYINGECEAVFNADLLQRLVEHAKQVPVAAGFLGFVVVRSDLLAEYVLVERPAEVARHVLVVEYRLRHDTAYELLK